MKASQGTRSEKSGLRYQEIEAWLREIILNGRPGEVIPSEVEIAASFEVSRMTARQAVLNLMREGLVAAAVLEHLSQITHYTDVKAYFSPLLKI
jgi:DNA-binding GntR family transcriptional regulator